MLVYVVAAGVSIFMQGVCVCVCMSGVGGRGIDGVMRVVCLQSSSSSSIGYVLT